MLDPNSTEYSEEEKQRILQAYRERGSKSAISRIFGTGRNTLSRCLKVVSKKGRRANSLAEQVKPPKHGDVLEFDECWT